MTRAHRYLLLHCAVSYFAAWPVAALFSWGQGLTALGYWPPVFSWQMAAAPALLPVTLVCLLGWLFEAGMRASVLVAVAAAASCYALPFWAGHYLVVTRGTRSRVAPGRCTRCDYDLTGNASGVCPECGTEVAQ